MDRFQNEYVNHNHQGNNIASKKELDIFDAIEHNTNNIKRLKCKRCGHEWNYKGKDKYRADCPKCHTTVVLNPVRKIRKRKIKKQHNHDKKIRSGFV